MVEYIDLEDVGPSVRVIGYRAIVLSGPRDSALKGFVDIEIGSTNVIFRGLRHLVLRSGKHVIDMPWSFEVHNGKRQAVRQVDFRNEKDEENFCKEVIKQLKKVVSN